MTPLRAPCRLSRRVKETMAQPVALANVHPRTFIAVDPLSGQRSLIAEVHPDSVQPPNSEMLRDFERRLFDRNVRVGLIVTPMSTVVIRDLLSAMDFQSNTYAKDSIDASDLMRAAGLRTNVTGNIFVAQVRTWLDAVATSWHSFLPPSAVPLLIPDVVGNLAQANLEEWNDVLGPNDAR